jgi:hypothetical protein
MAIFLPARMLKNPTSIAKKDPNINIIGLNVNGWIVAKRPGFPRRANVRQAASPIYAV